MVTREISPLWLLKCGLRASEIVKIGNFSYKFSIKQFLQNLAWGRESQVRTLMPNFTALAL